MEDREIRLRLIEAAARNPLPHPQGFAAGVLETATKWEEYVLKISGPSAQKDGTLKLPKKAV
jgi:hypothetical protein